MRIVSWNVNGLRAIVRKSGWEDMLALDPDVVCLQETKCRGIPLPRDVDWELSFRSDADKTGYSGVLTATADEDVRAPLLDGGELDDLGYNLTREGRTMLTVHSVGSIEFLLVNCYFPNGGRGEERLQYKHDFYADVCMYLEEIRDQIPVVLCGDLNTAHTPLDLKNPHQNRNTSGFLPMEREWLDVLEGMGMVDVWRFLYPHERKYTWWDYRTHARKRNAGWRIDHFWVDERLMGRVHRATIHNMIQGSDHCPISLELR
jgi:exodeoxyribonuclease-3